MVPALLKPAQNHKTMKRVRMLLFYGESVHVATSRGLSQELSSKDLSFSFELHGHEHETQQLNNQPDY